MSTIERGNMQSSGWPGHLWIEGNTLVHLPYEQSRPSHMPRGPAAKSGGSFLNPAMAPARTRSVMLLNDALEFGWLVEEDEPIRILDAMCSTGVRARRWRNEIPDTHQHRLWITANDLDSGALEWGKLSHAHHPPRISVERELESGRFDIELGGELQNGIHWTNLDARRIMIDSSFQWIDLDPFGSPVSFLDIAMQSLARKGVLEVTATDTAALTGSSPGPAKRRYGSSGIVDTHSHDDAVRVLLAEVARAAARNDRIIQPLLSLFDGHHVRVSVLVQRSKKGASEVHKNIGWKIRDEVNRFSDEPEGECSGPMWTGPLFDAEIAARITDKRAIELSQPNNTDEIEGWNDNDDEYSRREITRSVRYIADCAPIVCDEHLLIALNDIPTIFGKAGPPSVKKLISGLQDMGAKAARAPYLEPMIVTDASIDVVKKLLNQS